MSIRGFWKETKPLSDEELNIVRIMTEALNTYPKGIQYKKPEAYFTDKLKTVGFNVSPTRWRKLIQHVRVNDLVLHVCSDNRGYWIAETPDELKETLLSLHDRIRHQTATYNALRSQYGKWTDHNALFDSNKPDTGAKPLL